MAVHFVVAALAVGAAFVLLAAAISVVAVRRRDPIGKTIAGYASAMQALRDTSARATTTATTNRAPSTPARAAGESSDDLSSVNVITATDGGPER